MSEHMQHGLSGVVLARRAEVYAANREYARTNRWNTPAAIRPSDADHLNGLHWRACEDCGGTGRFPMPDRTLNDFCVACKGQGLSPVMV